MSPRRKQQHRMQHNVSLPAWSDAPELVKDGVLHVSIHVPAWGATTEFLAMRLPTMFQSTLPRGERLTTTQTIYLRYLFQSTLPRGERQHRTAVRMRTTGFNPRSRVGSDTCARSARRHEDCFNPRSRVGSDRAKRVRTILTAYVSIHAPAWGATPVSTPAFMSFDVSIHAPAWGATIA